MCILPIHLSNISIITLLCLVFFRYGAHIIQRLMQKHQYWQTSILHLLSGMSVKVKWKKGGGGQDDFSGIGDFTFESLSYWKVWPWNFGTINFQYLSEWLLFNTNFFFNFSLYHSKNKLIKSPKQRLETYCFCSVSYYYYYYSPFFLSVDHELVHGRSQELLDRISWNLVEL